MKRFWLVLLSLGLIVAFSTTAMAVDLKFSGEYYAAGMYIDKGDLAKNTAFTNVSSAFYFQRLRLSTTFIVHPGLMLITRADIMERAWGAARSTPATGMDTLSAGTRAENENIAFDLAYAMYVSPVGVFLAGYQIDGAWGTVFGDNSLPTGKIGYMYRGGPITLGIQTGKNIENSLRATAFANNYTDRDSSFYTAYGVYAWKGGVAGILGKYIRNAVTRTLGLAPFPSPLYDTGVKADVFVLVPYVKAQVGPVAVQAEFTVLYGKQKWEGRPDLIGMKDVDMLQMSLFVDAVGDFGMFYVGGTGAYISGDDKSSTDKAEGGTLTGGLDWNPCLMLFNSDMTYWQGGQFGYNATTNGGVLGGQTYGAYFLQGRAGVRPVDKLNIMASLSWARSVTTPAGVWEGRGFGFEVDLTATYKITNNLSYMLGGGYFLPGDFFKGVNAIGGNELTNNFMVINKLTLTF